MPASRTIPHTENADLVTYALLINGQELSRTVPVLSIDVRKEVNRVPFARIRIGDGDPALQDFPLSNEEHLVPGNEMEIRIGYRNDNNRSYTGIIVSPTRRTPSP